MMIFPSIITAISDPITDPNAYKPGSINTSDANVVAQRGGIIFNILSTLGIIVAVITIIVIELSIWLEVFRKSRIQKTMIPILVGVVMIIGS